VLNLSIDPSQDPETSISVIDLALNAVIKTIRPAFAIGCFSELLFNPDGSKLYLVSDKLASGITTIATDRFKILASAPLLRPAGAALSQDGKIIYASSGSATPNALSAISTTPDPNDNSPLIFNIPTPANGVGQGFLSKVVVTPGGPQAPGGKYVLIIADGIGAGFVHKYDVTTKKNSQLS
jgi:hypothetical protein